MDGERPTPSPRWERRNVALLAGRAEEGRRRGVSSSCTGDVDESVEDAWGEVEGEGDECVGSRNEGGNVSE